MRNSQRAIVAAIAISLFGCDALAPDRWDAFVYPDANDLTQWQTLIGFKDFEQCQSAAIDAVRALRDPDAGTYECGRNCKYDPAYRLNVCKETRR
ncbi:hypothetical protein [Sphingomicrobium nitratireducens]|uniref:hypothetical protein n=1 Tax=Sphingomicrobium nitratireducens TaxID=2964666 RepID=UPI00223F0E43|nr:hypothetical protein [Sphingomicrobium nitratireducens]